MKNRTVSISNKEGIFLLKIIKRLILSYLHNKGWIEKPQNTPRILIEKQGIFVSIVKKDDSDTLEKYIYSIGNHNPNISLIDTALSAATRIAINMGHDSHLFQSLISYLIRIDLLSELVPITSKDHKMIKNSIKVGEDGLLIERGHFKGIVLPRVPIINNWTHYEYLSECCIKAGLIADAWLEKNVEIYTFRTEVFEDQLSN